MSVPQGMRQTVGARRVDGSQKPVRYGLVRVKSQYRKPNPETGRKRWQTNDPKPEKHLVDVTRFHRGDRFGWTTRQSLAGAGQTAQPSARQEWRETARRP